MAHRSWCAEQDGVPSNERLEFLGDAVLGLVVADHVYRTYPELSEGQLTDARKAVVNAACLAELAAQLRLGEALALGKGEDAAGGRHRPSILADALEATIGAVYLDGGWEAAHALILRLLTPRVAEAVTGVRGQDHKTMLQELVAQRFGQPVRYHLSETGPDHDKEFTARAVVDGVERGVGRGPSKKRAEQAAAREALAALEVLAEAGSAPGAPAPAPVRTPQGSGTTGG
jgi:ribonuclease-3